MVLEGENPTAMAKTTKAFLSWQQPTYNQMPSSRLQTDLKP
jgi:hypothetical protein